MDSLLFAACLLQAAAAPQDPFDPAQGRPEAVRKAVVRALEPVNRSVAEYPRQRKCFSCHHQTLPLLAMTVARDRGVPVDAKAVEAMLKLTAESLESGREAYLEGRGQGGKAATAAYGLWTLERGGWKPDATTAVVADYLLVAAKGKESWKPPSNRPPLEVSSFMATALSLRALQVYGTEEKKAKAAEQEARTLAWLRATKAEDTEDRVFRLLGLAYAGADVEAAAKELRETQREDGGWAQLAGMEGDAYATGSALVALLEHGGLKPEDAVYRRGAAFLLGSQKEDGSWHVATRSKPVQTFFESGFPHGKDQYISIAATSWAAAALALGLPKAAPGNK